MEELNYKKKSWHAWLYISTYGGNEYCLPKSICNYFWGLAFAIIIFIPSYIGHIINIFRKNDKYDKITAWHTIFITLISFVIPAGVIEKASYMEMSLLKMHLTGLGILLAFIIFLMLIILIMAGISYLLEGIKGIKHVKIAKNPLVEGFKSFKEKYCKKINWN